MSGLPSVKRTYLDRRPTGEGSLSPPSQRLVHVSGFQDPKNAGVLLGLQLCPLVTSTFPPDCTRTDLALVAARRPPTKILTRAAIISSLSTSISIPIPRAASWACQGVSTMLWAGGRNSMACPCLNLIERDPSTPLRMTTLGSAQCGKKLETDWTSTNLHSFEKNQGTLALTLY